MALNLTKKQVDELSHHHWRVFTNDSITQQAITDELAKRGESSCSQTNIFHAGVEVPVFIIADFRGIILYLAINRHKIPYSFTAYHRKTRSEGWRVWRENKETAVQKLMKELPVSVQKLKAEALKKRKRDNIMKKSALMAM